MNNAQPKLPDLKNELHASESQLDVLAQRIDVLQKAFDSGDRRLAYETLRQYVNDRRSQIYTMMGTDEEPEAQIMSFMTLEKLRFSDNRSEYVSRMLLYAQLVELHHFGEIMSGDGIVLPIEEKSDPQAWGEYARDEFMDPAPKGIAWQVSDEYLEHTSEPEATLLKRYASLLSQYPTLGDTDFYPPSPYAKLINDGNITELRDEVAIETLSLFGLPSTEGISEDATTRLYEFGVAMDSDTFCQIKAYIEKIERHFPKSMTDDAKRELAKVFLATEFGDDYGDSIASIIKHSNFMQAYDIFKTMDQFRNSADKISAWFESYDSEFADDIRLALNERLTDALAALEVLARDGGLTVDTSPGRHAVDYQSDGRFVMNLESMDEGMEILHALGKSLQLIHNVITAEDVVVHRATEENSQFMTYRFSSDLHGDALLYVRPEGAKGYDYQLEYGNRKGVEASISFIVNPTDPHHLNLYKDPQGVSIRLDREGRMTDESPFAVDRDPTKDDGSISIDVSSLMGDGRHTPVKIGRFIAAGNIIRAARTGREESLHHNNKHFDQARYGNREGFSKLAVYMAHMAEAMIAIQNHGAHASRYQSIPRAA